MLAQAAVTNASRDAPGVVQRAVVNINPHVMVASTASIKASSQLSSPTQP